MWLIRAEYILEETDFSTIKRKCKAAITVKMPLSSCTEETTPSSLYLSVTALEIHSSIFANLCSRTRSSPGHEDRL